ncbi:MFS transporter [Mycobacterium heidelbergense]|uniref:MFS transporter n=1 Tax=Mycobacterium heidelbergense TaxID=53376 RepID=UPI003CEF2A04
MTPPTTMEQASAEAHTARLDSRLWLITAACTLLPVMITLNATVVNAAPRLNERFASTGAVAWSVTGYTLAMAAVIPLAGWAARRVGAKPLFLGSVLLFSWASLLCVQAPNVGLLAVFRAFQGLGGGMLIPLLLIILAHAAGPRRLGRVLAISMVPILLAPICGPDVGGWLIDSFGWKSIFLINIPIGVLTLIVAGFVLPEDVPTATDGCAIVSPPGRRAE